MTMLSSRPSSLVLIGATASFAFACSGADEGSTLDGQGGTQEPGEGVDDPEVNNPSGSGGAAPSPGITGGTGGDGTTGGEPGAGGASGGEFGTGGDEGTGGAEPEQPFGPVSCLPAFVEACTPPIEFENQEPEGRGKVFNTVVPDPVATLQDTACTVCSILYRDPSEIPSNKHPSKIRLVLDFHGGVAQAGGEQIQFDLNYIDGFTNRSEEEARIEMLGVLMHETVHLYQNYGNGGTGEGMADYVRIRTGLYGPGRRGSGGSWKDAYTTSGFFYSWLAGPCEYHMDGRADHNKDLGYFLNEALGGAGDPYDNVNGVLLDAFGKSADELWAEYQSAL